MSDPGSKPDAPSSNFHFSDTDADAYFPRDLLRHSTSMHSVGPSEHAHSVVAQSAVLENAGGPELEHDLERSDSFPLTPRDPFLTPAPSAQGSSHNLTLMAGATASSISIQGSGYSFASFADGQVAGADTRMRDSSDTNASAEIVTLPRTNTGSDSVVPPVPSLSFMANRNARSKSGNADLTSATSTGAGAPSGKRESFAAPPPMKRLYSTASLGAASGRTRRTSQRPTIGSSVPGTPALPSPRSSSYSLSEKATGDPGALRGVMFQDRKAPTGLTTRRMQSQMLGADEVLHKPWLTTPVPRARTAYWLTFCFAMVGVIGSFLRIYFGAKGVQLLHGNLCLVLDDEFNGSQINESIWAWEVQMDGFGNGEFEMTTDSPNNSFVEDGILYIVPTLTSDVIGSSAVFDGHTFNLTGCTSLNSSACSAVSNITSRTVINPIQSARLTTRNSSSIQYGRVETRAKIPRGDWIWPALWMLPVDNTYGPWPISGEIDIMEARGNAKSYPAQGRDYVRASLNWGPLTWLNEVSKTFGWWNQRRRSFDEDFHIYGFEWSDKFVRAYVDSRLQYMLDVSFNEPFFNRGDFPPTVFNGSSEIAVPNPWGDDNFSAPFNQAFYLIMDVAVGGTSGWFPDNDGDKPWLDQSLTAMYDFARAQDTWYATWPTDVRDRGMAIDYVKMWQLC